MIDLTVTTVATSPKGWVLRLLCEALPSDAKVARDRMASAFEYHQPRVQDGKKLEADI